jgi:serine/threonine-protein kinase
MRNFVAASILLVAVGCGTDDQVTGDDGAEPGSDYAGPASDTPDDDPADDPSQPPGPAPATGPYFETPMFWNENVSALPKAANSDAIIASLNAGGGWGNGNRFTVDTDINVLHAAPGTPMRTFTKNSLFYSPDCDDTAIPVPAGGNVEANTGYTCATNGDCHLIVYDAASKKLYELYKASITSSTFTGGCLAVWDTSKTYSDSLRGDQCSSADAAGFPVAPLLLTPDEVNSGAIHHAVRLILPNTQVKKGFVRPATHGTNTTGGANAPYYGVHLRLRKDFPIDSLPSEGAKTVARALQEYGAYHADGGQKALTVMNDRDSATKWAGLLAEFDLEQLEVTDFEVIDHGGPTPITYACARN